MMRRTEVRRTAATTAAFLALAAPALAQAPSGGNGLIYMSGYDNAVHIVDESTLEVVGDIQTRSGIPYRLVLSHDRSRIYSLNAESEEIEILDLESRESVDRFTLSETRSKVRIWEYQVDPDNEYMALVSQRYTRLRDRWKVDDPVVLKYDLGSKQVTDTIPWPEGESRERARLMFSPGGEYLYFFGNDVLVLETENFTEVDRWALSQPLEGGLGRLSFGFPESLNDDPGFHTGLFRLTDPVQNRRMMGIARVNLAEKDFDFYTLGPNEPVSFVLAPGGRKAYGLIQRIGDYQVWTFDLESREVENRIRFDGRPRMSLEVSSNGELLYIHNAGATIDVYRADTFEFVRTATYDFDMIRFLMIPESLRGDGD